jgi:hypothetical protein
MRVAFIQAAIQRTLEIMNAIFLVIMNFVLGTCLIVENAYQDALLIYWKIISVILNVMIFTAVLIMSTA